MDTTTWTAAQWATYNAMRATAHTEADAYTRRRRQQMGMTCNGESYTRHYENGESFTAQRW